MPPSSFSEMGVLCKLHISALHLGTSHSSRDLVISALPPDTLDCHSGSPGGQGVYKRTLHQWLLPREVRILITPPWLPRLVTGIEVHKVDPCSPHERAPVEEPSGSNLSEIILGACRSLGPAGAGVAQPHPLPPSHPPHTPEPPTLSDLTISCTLCHPPLGATVRARKGPAPNPTKLLLTCVLCVLQTFLSAVAGKPTNPC